MNPLAFESEHPLLADRDRLEKNSQYHVRQDSEDSVPLETRTTSTD